MPTLSKLKSYRVDDQHDIVNHFSLNANTGAKGLLVSPVGSGLDLRNLTPQIKSNLAATISRTNAYSPLYEITSKVQACPSGVKPFGIMLNDVLATDAWGYPLRYEKELKEDRECVVSGEAVPIARRGIFQIFVGTGAGSAVSGGASPTYLAASDDGLGNFKLQSSATNACGEFISNRDADGYALVYINCYKV